jgi:hypothetical protein
MSSTGLPQGAVPKLERPGMGGELLVRAVTQGPVGKRLPGNFPEYHLMP